MAHELQSVDINHAPSLSDLVDEVRRTNRPRVLRRANEDVAVISPIHKQSKQTKQKNRGLALSAAGIPRYTLEQVFGSVPTPPHVRGKDIEEMIREAKEERAARMMKKL